MYTAHGSVQRSKEARQQRRPLHVLCSLANGDSFTLHCHEVGKVPDEFANDVLLPLLVQHVVVALQHDVLVLLGEHHRWILARTKPESSLRVHWFLGLICKSHEISGALRPTDTWNPYCVKSGHGVGAVLALDNGLLVRVVPVLKLRVELDGDDLQVARVVVPGQVAVHTDHIHIRSLWTR